MLKALAPSREQRFPCSHDLEKMESYSDDVMLCSGQASLHITKVGEKTLSFPPNLALPYDEVV